MIVLNTPKTLLYSNYYKKNTESKNIAQTQFNPQISFGANVSKGSVNGCFSFLKKLFNPIVDFVNKKIEVLKNSRELSRIKKKLHKMQEGEIGIALNTNEIPPTLNEKYVSNVRRYTVASYKNIKAANDFINFAKEHKYDILCDKIIKLHKNAYTCRIISIKKQNGTIITKAYQPSIHNYNSNTYKKIYDLVATEIIKSDKTKEIRIYDYAKMMQQIKINPNGSGNFYINKECPGIKLDADLFVVKRDNILKEFETTYRNSISTEDVKSWLSFQETDIYPIYGLIYNGMTEKIIGKNHISSVMSQCSKTVS